LQQQVVILLAGNKFGMAPNYCPMIF
jgi:hypothetical protein